MSLLITTVTNTHACRSACIMKQMQWLGSCELPAERWHPAHLPTLHRRAAPRPTPAAPTSSGNGAANGGESSSYLAQSGLPNAHAREKNRQAQRRFRERQKGTIAQLQAQVEELHMQVRPATQPHTHGPTASHSSRPEGTLGA